MLETILAGSTKKINATGPGPQKLLFGDSSLGYYGKVTAAEAGLNYTALGSMPGTLINATPPLLKFAENGTVLFIPMAAYRNKVAWFDLYKAGAVYGSGTTGWNFGAVAGVTQNYRVTTKDGSGNFNTFKVRMPYSIDSVDPANQPAATRLNEISELFGRVTNGTWDNFTLKEVQMSSDYDLLGGWSMTTGALPLSNSHWWYKACGGTGSVSFQSSSAKDYTYDQVGFRPVFVYVP